jgi:hypothetical protein
MDELLTYKGCGTVRKNVQVLPVIVILNMRVDGLILVYAVEREVKKYSIDERICV